ncbi:MAG: hypothetical protein ACK5CW_13110 [Verrucomicrobiota bacterium]|jgi:hypothetical protein
MRCSTLAFLTAAACLTPTTADAAPRRKPDRRTLKDEAATTTGYVFRKSITLRKGDKPPAGSLSGNVWDLKGLTIDGRDSGDCCDREGGAKITIRWPGITIRNGSFINWPDGVGIAAPGVTFENVHFANCEDALNTNKGARDWTIRHCSFQPAPRKKTRQNGYPGDKAIQANVTDGTNLIENCSFAGFRNAIRSGSQKYRKSAGTVVCRSNQFSSVATAIHAVAGHTFTDPAMDRFQNVDQPFRRENPGQLHTGPLR